jgi:hypothetical protein
MFLCYVDESGTSDVPGTSSHFVLAGLAIPIWQWRNADLAIAEILSRYGLSGQEIHTAWMLRKYLEQSRIPSFDSMDWASRRSAVRRERIVELLRLQKIGDKKALNQTKKNQKHTEAYIHLSLVERSALIRELAHCVSGWSYARLFAECIDKTHFDPARSARTIDEQAFEQVISRFEQYLANTSKDDSMDRRNFGLVVHDNNQTVARKHTELMRQFHHRGTLWTKINRIIETPLFVDSQLTGMVQIADLCSYAVRRYLENQESELFGIIFARADRVGEVAVGVRHFTGSSCVCAICQAHRRNLGAHSAR